MDKWEGGKKLGVGDAARDVLRAVVRADKSQYAWSTSPPKIPTARGAGRAEHTAARFQKQDRRGVEFSHCEGGKRDAHGVRGAATAYQRRQWGWCRGACAERRRVPLIMPWHYVNTGRLLQFYNLPGVAL